MRLLIASLILTMSMSVSAEAWNIGKYLTVSPGEQLDVTLQIEPSFDPDEELIHGWKGDDLHYMLVTDHQPGGKRAKKYWKGFLKELKNDADNKQLNIDSEGSFTTDAGQDVTYKIVSWVSDGDSMLQMLSLIIGKKDAYWVMAVPMSDDVDYMVESTKAILKTAVLTRQ